MESKTIITSLNLLHSTCDGASRLLEKEGLEKHSYFIFILHFPKLFHLASILFVLKFLTEILLSFEIPIPSDILLMELKI